MSLLLLLVDPPEGRRVTEAGDIRITEDGKNRITEDGDLVSWNWTNAQGDTLLRM